MLVSYNPQQDVLGEDTGGAAPHLERLTGPLPNRVKRDPYGGQTVREHPHRLLARFFERHAERTECLDRAIPSSAAGIPSSKSSSPTESCSNPRA